MLVWEAHRALSASIGDTVTCTSISVPDGVRYSKAMRDSYLYRAMLHIMSQVLSIAGKSPKQVSSQIAAKAFPEMVAWQLITGTLSGTNRNMRIYRYNLASANLLFKPAMILNVFGTTQATGANHDTVPIPLKDPLGLASLLNSRNVQSPDTFAVYYDQFGNQASAMGVLDVYSADVNLFNTIQMHYLRYPLNPASQALTDRTGLFQTTMFQTVLGLASLYAKVDDQETGSLERFMPSLTETSFASYANVGGNAPQ